ncbi:hypothetical protein [Virgibacillus ainsalahensis]
MDCQNDLSAIEKIMSEIENLPKEKKLVVLNEIKHKYFPKHNDLLIKEDEPRYDDGGTSDFSDFLKAKKAEYQEEEVNWINIKKEWIEQLNRFMKQIDEWLEDQQKNKTISLKETNLTLQEEHLGEYKAPSRELSISIKPIGRLIIGAKGRIDIHSSYEKYILLYLQDRDWVYRKETDRGKFHHFSRENFERILEDLL